MIFFVNIGGTVVKSVPSPVYQGSIGEKIYVVAPFSADLEATVAFKLPNGVWLPRERMTRDPDASSNLIDTAGERYSVWTYSLGQDITRYFGTVTAQFFFYAEENGRGMIRAGSSTSFVVGKGVPMELPEEDPPRDIYQDILSALSGLRSLIDSGEFAARAIFEWNADSGFVYQYGEITFYPNAGKFGSFVRSKKSYNIDAPYDEDGNINSECWEEVVNFDHIATGYFEELKNLADSTNKRASEAVQARDDAVQARDDARNAAREMDEIKDKMVHLVQELPEYEEAVEGEVYAVLADHDGNIFTLWVPKNGEWVYFGRECFLANGLKQYELTLSVSSWEEKRQSLVLPEFTEGWRVDSVIPAEKSAMKYLLDGIRFQSVEGGILTFSCDTVPEEDVLVIAVVKAEYPLPTLSQYYTRLQTERLVEEKIGEVVAGAPSAFDTLKEIAEYIEEDKAGAAVLIGRVAKNEADISAETKARTAADQKLSDEKQDAQTDALNTVSKTIVGAINEQNDFLNRVKEEVSATYSFRLTIHPEDWNDKELSLYANNYPELERVTLDSFVRCIPSAICAAMALKYGIGISSHTTGSITLSCQDVPDGDYAATIIIENHL